MSGAARRARRRDDGAPARPTGTAADAVAVRYVRDGEPKVVVAEIDRETETDVWWRATFPVWNPATPYRWLLSGGDYGYAWLNGVGLQPFGRPRRRRLRGDAGHGRPGVAPRVGRLRGLPGPLRVVRPRRRRRPSGLCRGDGTSCPTGRGPETPFEWFGGDLAGLERAARPHRRPRRERPLPDPDLSRAAARIATTRRRSTRSTRCSAATRRSSRSSRAAHARDMRVLGDLTTNHVGSGHEWFVAAREGHEPEREFFFFDDRSSTATRAGTTCRRCPSSTTRSERAPPPLLRERRLRGAALARAAVSTSTAGASTSRNQTGRRRDADLLVEVASGVRRLRVAARADARRRRRALVTTLAPTSAGRLARHDELRGLHEARLGVAARRTSCPPVPSKAVPRAPRRRAAARGRGRRRGRCAASGQASRGRASSTRG